MSRVPARNLKDEFNDILHNAVADVTGQELVNAIREAFEEGTYKFKGTTTDHMTDETVTTHDYVVTIQLTVSLWGDQEKRVLDEYLTEKNTS
jgi:hypothetical protein